MDFGEHNSIHDWRGKGRERREEEGRYYLRVKMKGVDKWRNRWGAKRLLSPGGQFTKVNYQRKGQRKI